MKLYFRRSWKVGYFVACEWFVDSFDEWWHGLYLGFVLITWHTTKVKKLTQPN